MLEEVPNSSIVKMEETATDAEVAGPTVVGKPVGGPHLDNGADFLEDVQKSDGSPNAAERRPPTKLTNPEDVPDALPPGRVKLLSFLLVFLVWVGSWGLLDELIGLIG